MDSIGSEFEEQGGVPDWIESSRHVLSNGPDLMCDVEDLHPSSMLKLE